MNKTEKAAHRMKIFYTLDLFNASFDCLTIESSLNEICSFGTSKSFSEALILASTNPQYDKRLFIEFRVQYMKIASSVHVVYTNCFLFLYLQF